MYSNGYSYRKRFVINAQGDTSGTITVTNDSIAVTGSGTSFTDWNRHDQIQMPNGDWYQIDNVTSATALTLSLPYRGTGTTDSYSVKHINYQKRVIVHKGAGSDSGEDVYLDSKSETWSGSDPTDIRFTDSTGSEGNKPLIPYYRFSADGSTAVFYLKLPVFEGSTTNFYIYYGNSSPVAPTVPPLGNFPQSSEVIDGAWGAENMVWDSASEMYWWTEMGASTDAPTLWYYEPTLTTDPPSTTPADWTEDGQAFTPIADRLYLCPHLVQFGSTWHLYYTRTKTDIELGDEGELYVQTSNTVNSGYGDELKVLSQGGAGTWDEHRVDEAFVFYNPDDSLYYLFYMGETDDGDLFERIGYATSSSPTSGFSKYADNPIMDGSHEDGHWNSGNDRSADPWVVRWGDDFYIGYAATESGKWVPTTGPGFGTGIAKTTDFELFEEFSGNPIMFYGDNATWNNYAAWRGAMVVDEEAVPLVRDDKYWLAYSARARTGANWGCGLSSMSTTRAAHDYPPEQVFIFFDHFDGATINGDKWNTYITPTVAASILTLNADNEMVFSKNHFGFGTAFISSSNMTNNVNHHAGYIHETDQLPAAQYQANYPAAASFNSRSIIDGSNLEATDIGDDSWSGNYATWEVRRVYVSGAKSNIFYVNEGLEDTDTTDIYLLPIQAGFRGIAATAMLTAWVLIRAACNPEPSFGSWGSEETGIISPFPTFFRV